MHTLDALKNLSSQFKRTISRKKILLLFGCGGNRDQDKRSKWEKLQIFIQMKYSLLMIIQDMKAQHKSEKKLKKE